MQKLIQETLKLTASSEARLWTELESKLMVAAPKFSHDEFINVCQHFGDHEKGSSNFWDSMSKVLSKNADHYNAGQFMMLFDAFSHAGTQYKFSDEFEKKMMNGVFFASKKVKENLIAVNPNSYHELLKEMRNNLNEFEKKADPFLDFEDDLNTEPNLTEEEIRETQQMKEELRKKWEKDPSLKPTLEKDGFEDREMGEEEEKAAIREVVKEWQKMIRQI